MTCTEEQAICSIGCVFSKKIGGDADGTIEIVVRSIKESGEVTETVLTSFEREDMEKRVSVYENVWNESGDSGATVTNVVSQIRRKIGDKYIRTVIGSGYKFEV